MRRRIFAVILSISLASLAQADTPLVTLGTSPTLGGGEYSSGGGITVAVEPRRTATGLLAVCGVWAQSERLTAYVRQSGRDVLSRGNLRVNGRLVHRDLRFLTRVAARASYAKAQATCVGTSLRWKDRTELEVHIPRHVVVQDRDGNGSGLEIRFAPSQVANPALLSGSVLPAPFTSLKGVFNNGQGASALTQ